MSDGSLLHAAQSALVAFALTLSASGCVSITGNQKATLAYSAHSSSKDDQTFLSKQNKYINADVISPFYSLDASQRNGMTSAQWRNAVIDARVGAANIHYARFVQALDSERNTIGLATGLSALGLSGAASVAGQATANALSAAAAGVTGAGGAFNQQVFAAKTVQVLVTQMDANRELVFARLVVGERQTTANYSMGQALNDLADFEGAGSLDRALNKVAEAAAAAKTIADAIVKAASLPPYEVVLIDGATQQRKAALTRYIKGLADDRLDQLRAISLLLGLEAPDGASAIFFHDEIIPELDRRIGSGDLAIAATQIDGVSRLLKSTTNRDF